MKRLAYILGAVLIVLGLLNLGSAVPPRYTGVNNISGPLILDFQLEAARGNIAGISTINKFGRNTVIASGATADIWDNGQTGGTLLYIAPTTARVHALVSTSATDVNQVSTLTLDAVVADTETLTIGTKVYTFQTTLTNVDGNVLIGANADASLLNLTRAVNLGTGAGSLYATLMTANADGITAVEGAGVTLLVYAPEQIATTEALAGGTNSWDAATTTAGTGAHTLRLFGLTAWDSAETSEIIVLTGVTTVDTSNSYVFIHRMMVLTKGGTKVNTGAITATADTDSSVSAKINVNQGQTQMAIYAVPRGKVAYIDMLYANVNKAGGNAGLADVSLLVNPEPQDELTQFVVRHTAGLMTVGSSELEVHFQAPKRIPGPAIIKVQCLSGAATMDVSAGFDITLVDN